MLKEVFGGDGVESRLRREVSVISSEGVGSESDRGEEKKRDFSHKWIQVG